VREGERVEVANGLSGEKRSAFKLPRCLNGFQMTDHQLFKNAVGAIQVGVEDFNEGSPYRLASAIRSLTAGLLLLCKEKLRRLSPQGDILIWKNIKPVLGEDGNVVFKAVGQATVDVQDITERFKSFEIECDFDLLKKIAKIRNAVEHHYVEDGAQIRSAFVSGLTFLSRFMPEQLGVDPVDALDPDVWGVLVKQKEIEDALRQECRSSYENLDWPPLLKSIIENVGCPECSSPLVKQMDVENTSASNAVWQCSACGCKSKAEDWVAKVVSEHYASESFLAAKDGDRSPIEDCPDCGNETFINEISECLVCGFELKDAGECAICGEPLELEDYGENLCSYHRYVMEKERNT